MRHPAAEQASLLFPEIVRRSQPVTRREAFVLNKRSFRSSPSHSTLTEAWMQWHTQRSTPATGIVPSGAKGHSRLGRRSYITALSASSLRHAGSSSGHSRWPRAWFPHIQPWLSRNPRFAAWSIARRRPGSSNSIGIQRRTFQ